jgi:radical SAM superfamily enzyme YgiQ (UPF0313 family)
MKIYFVNPPFKPEYGRFSRESRSPAITKSGTLYYPLWLIYAAAYAKKFGNKILFLDAPAKSLNSVQTIEIIKKQVSGKILFVVDTSTPSIKNDVDFAAELKKICPEAFILLVGTHPSALPQETLMLNSAVDAVARGEYDCIVAELAKAIDAGCGIENVKGLTYKDINSGEIISNENMPYMENLDDLPYAAEFIKEYLDVRDYFFAAATFPEIQIFTGRGCPGRCNFCLYPQIMHGHKYRTRSAQNIIGEFQYIADNFPDVKEIVIEDDTFTTSKERIVEICNMLIERNLHKRLKWLCNARVNLDLETMIIMKKAGCRLIIPGIESADQQILNNVKKGIKVEQVENYVKNAKKAGLLIHACYMVGNQGESIESMNNTLKLALKLNTDTAQFITLIPYPGTEAFNWARLNGYIDLNYENYCKKDGTHNTVLNLPELTAKQMVDFCDKARKKYYLRLKYVFYRIMSGMFNFDDLKRSLKAFLKLKQYLLK